MQKTRISDLLLRSVTNNILQLLVNCLKWVELITSGILNFFFIKSMDIRIFSLFLSQFQSLVLTKFANHSDKWINTNFPKERQVKQLEMILGEAEKTWELVSMCSFPKIWCLWIYFMLWGNPAVTENLAN